MKESIALLFMLLTMIFYTLKVNGHFKYLYEKMNREYTGFFSAMFNLSVSQCIPAFLPFPIPKDHFNRKLVKFNKYYLVLYLLFFVLFFIMVFTFKK